MYSYNYRNYVYFVLNEGMMIFCYFLSPTVGLAFKQTSDSVILFVVTTETVLSYNTSAKDHRVSIDLR